MTTKAEVIDLANRGLGCLGKAAMDEPVFVLRAQDIFAPALLESWSRSVDAGGGGASDKAKRARALAHQMRAWQELNTKKVPD